jgi:hypothetical protein
MGRRQREEPAGEDEDDRREAEGVRGYQPNAW